MKKGLKILSILTLLASGMVSCSPTTSSSSQQSSSPSQVSSSESTSSSQASSSSESTSSSQASSSSESQSEVSSSNSSDTTSSSDSQTSSDTKVERITEFVADDLNGKTLTDYEINSAFKIVGSGAQFDTSSKTVTKIDGSEVKTSYRLKNLKQKGVGTYLQVSVSADNATLLLQIAAAGSSARTLTILDENGGEKYSISKTSSEAFEVRITLDKGVYTVGGSNGFNLYYAGLKEEVAQGKEIGFRVDSKNVDTNLLAGEELDLSSLHVYSKYDNDTEIELKDNEYTIDKSNLKINEAGTYQVGVKYKNYDTQNIEVNVSLIESIEVDDFLIGNKTGIRLPKVYKLNDVISTDSITLKGVSEKTSKLVEPTSIDLPSTASEGEKNITISKNVVGSSDNKVLSKNIKVTVIDSTKLVALADGSYSVNVDSSKMDGEVVDNVMQFSSIQNALDFYKTCNIDSSISKKITVNEGTYNEKIYVEIDNVSILSTTSATIQYDAIADTKDAKGNAFSTYGSSSVTVKGNNFYSKNITYRNSAYSSMDEYLADTRGNKQACAIVVDTDSVFDSCKFVGYQDTLYARVGNQKYVNCEISGMTDYIFGEDSNVYIKDSIITSMYRNSNTNGGYICVSKPSSNITSPNFGFVIDGCTIQGEKDADGNLKVAEGTVSLARPWGKQSKISYVNCNMDKSISKKAYGDSSDSKNPRFDQMSGNLPTNAEFSEYNNTGDGAITTSVTGGKILTEAEYNALMELVNAKFPA